MKSRLFKVIFTFFILLFSFGLASCKENEDIKEVNYVVNIEKTGSTGLKDIYTITYSNGTTETFEITHGSDGLDGIPGTNGQDGLNGINGVDGKPGIDGKVPHIGENGNWFIGDYDTGISVNGKDGAEGESGQDGKPGENNPHYGEILKVNFHLNGGSFENGEPESVEVFWGNTLSLPKPQKDGYLFKGWYTGDTANDKLFTENDKVFRNLDLYAKYDNTFTITFESNGGTIVNDIKFKPGDTIILENPTKESFVFGGWFTDPDLTKEFDLIQELPNNDFALYAKWNVMLEFDSRGGSEVKSIVGKPGSAIELPAAPVREGYVFLGWFRDEQNKVEQSIILPQKNGKCHAAWAKAEDSTALTLGKFKVQYQTQYVVEGNKFTATKEKGDYSFFAANIDFNVKSYGAVRLNIKGTKDVKILVKLEGGGADFIEKEFVMTGENQTIVMPVKENNLTATGGQRLLLFLNPGKAGCSDTPEYVEVNKAEIVKTIPEANKGNENSALFFVTNGGGTIDPMFGKVGSDLTLPKNPEKPHATFLGWYTDEKLTNKFEGTKFPESTTILYAKWHTEIKTVDMLNDTFVENDKDTYTFNKNKDGSLEVNKTVAKEWAFAKSSLTGKDIKGLGYLKITVTGTKGQRVLFKVNDQDGVAEKWIDFTGEKQYVVIEFSSVNILDDRPALLIFGQPDKSETCSFIIHTLEFTDELTFKSILNDNEFIALDKDSHTLTYADNKLNIVKTTENQYSFIKSATLTKDIAEYKYLVITLKGQKDEEILFKLFDRFETRLKLTGEVQQVVLDIKDTDGLLNNPVLFLVLNSAKSGTSKGIEFSQIDFIL